MRRMRTLGMILGLSAALCFCAKNKNTAGITGPDANHSVSGRYKNGLYVGQLKKDHEGYSTQARIEVRKGSIAVVTWRIFDNNLNRDFDETYEEVYTGNPLYIQQCRDNMVGMLTYGPRLVATQNIAEVECITGATWCFRKFRDVAKTALRDAVADTSLSGS